MSVSEILFNVNQPQRQKQQSKKIHTHLHSQLSEACAHRRQWLHRKANARLPFECSCARRIWRTHHHHHICHVRKSGYIHTYIRAHTLTFTSAAWRRTVNPLRLLSACVVVSWRWRPLMVLAGLQRFVATAVVSNKWATTRSQCNRKNRQNKSKIKWKVPSKSCAVLVVVRICMYIVCMYGQWDHCIGESELLTLTFLSEKLPLEWVWQCLRERPFQGVWRPVEVRYVCVAVYYTQRSQLDVIVIFNW